MANLKELHRQKRGQVSAPEVKQYENSSLTELSALLKHDDPRKRTIAARLIGAHRKIELIPLLCKSLAMEKSLYARIALSEALGKMGEPAVIPLLALLGKIGNNQETELPQKYCAKKSFPLARDMAARTLVKLGEPAISGLMETMRGGNHFRTQQALDAIGGIVSRTHDMRSLSVLLGAFKDCADNEVTIWKIVRALSAFQHVEALGPLIEMLKNHAEPSIRWEAARSIGHVGISTPEVIRALQNGLQDQNSEVRKAAKISLERIK